MTSPAAATDPLTPWRVAAISFLNTAPLLRGLENEAGLRLQSMLPAQCAEALRAGTADIGIIPVIEMARIPGLVALPEIAIAARSEVRSILLISRCPPARIRRLCLDPASRTSAALVQILLRRRFGAEFSIEPPTPDWQAMLARADGGLLIGDPALQVSVSGAAAAAGFETRDLAAEWHRWTGLPFVFALWAVRQERLERGGPGEGQWLAARFLRAKREGLAHLDELVAQWAPRLGLAPAEIRRYLEVDVEFDFTPEHRQGLARFFQLAAEMGLIASPRLPNLLSWRP
ncbi:MAG TPA: menaquinone biosynthesis protein [Terriglobales bacterium]|nr:menaquinone biosynthesis protein [Terriglobales bacterium]